MSRRGVCCDAMGKMNIFEGTQLNSESYEKALSLVREYAADKGSNKGGNENTVFTDDENLGHWYSAEEYDPETASIKEQIANSKDELNKMSLVAEKTVPKNLFNKTEAYNWAVKGLERINYSVYRKAVGEIRISRKDINKRLKYAKTSEERAAIALVPAILKYGREIGAHKNHKGRSKSIITFAAPVVMNGVRGNMAVMVNQNSDSYNAHRIVLPDGSAFKFSDIKKRYNIWTTSGSDPKGLSCQGRRRCT